MIPFEDAIRSIERIKTDDKFAQRVYASLCNTEWKHDTESDDAWDWGCTWRAAGGLVASIRGNDGAWAYMDFYCSGNEGRIDPTFATLMAAQGWQGREMT